MTAVLTLDRLQIGYGQALLPPISTRLEAGQLLAVVGRSGSGKSTLLRTLLRQQASLAGQWNIAKGTNITYVPQRHAFEGAVPFTGREVAATGLERGWSFLRRRQDDVFLEEALQDAGATELAERPFNSMSEGEKQRILLARVLVAQAGLALMDEPTAAMDLVTERATMQLVRRLCDTHGIAVVVVTHFVDLAMQVADRVLLLDSHMQVVEEGNPAIVARTEAFRHSFGHVHPQEPCA